MSPHFVYANLGRLKITVPRKLVDDRDGLVDFKNFAIGMHVVTSLRNSVISSAPSSLAPEDCEILEDVHMGIEVLTEKISFERDPIPSNICLPATVESDIRNFMEDLKVGQSISGETMLNLSNKYGISPTDIAQIWYVVIACVTYVLYC